MVELSSSLHQNRYQNSLFSFTLVPPGKKEWSGEHTNSQIGFNFAAVIADWSIDGGPECKKMAPKNSFVYYPKGIQHSVRVENLYHRLSFAWSDAYLDILMAGENRPGILQEFRDYQYDHALSALAKNVATSIFDGGPFLDLRLDGYAQAMLGHFLNAGRHENFEMQGTGKPSTISRAIDYALENLQSNLTIAKLADEAGLSAWHFARTFKATVGEAPHQWVMNQRFKKALNLLRFTTLSLGEIAFECGFATPAHLGNTIKNRTGKTPKEIRVA